MKTLLRTLTQIPAPSGREDVLRAAVQKLIQPHADEIRVDALGNLIARKGKKAKNGRRIMLAAHLDEIGLMVSHVDADGFARFSVLGGLSPHRRVGTRVKFLNGASGVIGLEKPSELKDRAPGIEKYFIDTGASSPKDSPVKIGDVAVFDTDLLDLGNRVISKALDDRIGVALLIESLRNLKSSPHEIYFVFTAQEEVGVRGAGPAAYGLDPEIGLSVDTTPASDTPGASLRNPIALGKGPAIKIKDPSMVSDPRLVDVLTRLAQKSRLPLQMEVLEGGSTDARAIQIARSGARAAGLSVPTRNIHSPSEMADWGDIHSAGRLLAALLRSTEL
jgi:putative aminopeptidase FrvX